ncbi:hypothetical protein G3I15_13815, partial [Streptomyces sp. SID10244]|nr:hypothetical protein [Streptomyces sp. SID10244]
MIKSGSRLESQVCETQVIVINPADSLDDLRCGGVAMVEVGASTADDVVLDDRFAGGSVLGKRYVDEVGAEVLVTRAGTGALSVGESPLVFKESK